MSDFTLTTTTGDDVVLICSACHTDVFVGGRISFTNIAALIDVHEHNDEEAK